MSTCCLNQRNPLYCIIPPYMLEAIEQNGAPEQKTWAKHTLNATDSLRDQREVVADRNIAGERAKTVPPVIDARVGGKNRLVYDAMGGMSLPGKLIRQENQSPTGDVAADEAYEGAGATYDLYWNEYQRDSIDRMGMALVSTVHYQRSFDNAFWNGHQMVYGDGDEDLPVDKRLFNRFTIAQDIIGHELSHGVIQYEANLNYSFQPGALNESVCDVFGSLVKQRQLKQPARTADWIIGQGLFTPNVRGVGIRSMKEPGTAYDDPILGKDPQPGHMSGYVNTTGDNGGVHINSGIPNRAFYIIAYELGGYAWEKAGWIWYAALTKKLTNTSNFLDAANATYAAAGELFGINSLEQQAVRRGWAEVGIEIAGEPAPAEPDPDALGCLPALFRIFGKGTR